MLRIKKSLTILIIVFITFIILFPIDTVIKTLKLVNQVTAADAPPNGFYIQTGNLLGGDAVKTITGLGFKPDLVILKPDTIAGNGAIFKTKAMTALDASYFVNTAQSSVGAITLEADGFSVNTTVSNNVNITTTWIAFGGSNCTSTGVFCIGSYTGNGVATRAITTGFQPDLVWTKRATAIDGNWRSSAMGTNVGQFFNAAIQDTTGILYTTLDATGFTVGATNNVAATVYYYVAFKNVAGAINVGTYTGNATDNRNITGVGFVPNFAFLKNASVAVGGVFNTESNYGDNTNSFTDVANLVNSIQGLQSDGFQVGTDASANSNTIVYNWAAFGGAASLSSGSGTFKSASGSYTGTGQNEVISKLDFSPNLVIIKGDTAQTGVFRTSQVGGDLSALLDAAAVSIAGAIISINPDGFSIGTSATVNTSGVTYYWTAYGNAWNAETNSGSSDFYIGAYYGNGIDNRNITRLPFQADMVTIKRNSSTPATFRISNMAGDISGFFAATADAANNIQALQTNGFQIGTSTNVNAAANVNFFFGFKSGANFAVGTYSGTGSSQNITSVGLQPDNLWIKATGATRGILRTAQGAANSALPFINVANVANAVTGLLSNGFTVNTAAETNTVGTNNYHYVAWKNNFTTTSPTYKMKTGYFMGNGAAKSLSGLGFIPDLVVIKSDTTATAAMFKTKYMPLSNTAFFINTADSIAGLITLNSDGFTVGGTANSRNVRYSWVAYGGSDCSVTGVFCTRSFIGNGTSPRAITTVGFQPDLVVTKRSTAVDGNWRSSSMGVNIGQFFSATIQDATAILYTTLDTTGFTVGATNNAATGIYYYFAFKSAAGSIAVGTYTGNAVDNRNITGVGFAPNFVFLKNASAASGGALNIEESFGDNSSLFTATANLVNSVQVLQADGFQLGTDATANANTNVYHWVSFLSGISNSTGSDSFKMASGSYVGNAGISVISGIPFSADLVIIKGNTAQTGVFRTSQMGGDSSGILDGATANIAGAIISINNDGFTVGTSATVNTSSVTYYWTAYGNAWNPETNSGSSDFYVGAYYGNGIDNRNISRLPFLSDMITIKRNGTTSGTFKTSAMVGDLSGFFAATAEAANNIQALQADGFQVGTAANVNTVASVYFYFGFKSGANFAVGTYSGTGASQNITTVGFQPNNLWIKQTGVTQGVSRTSNNAANSALPFVNVANVNNAITALLSNGFTVNTAAETNTAGTNNYRFVAWRTPAITITTNGTQTASINIATTNNYIGAPFTIVSNIASINVTRFIISETGTVAANSYVTNVKLLYETAVTCTYNGNETQFGTTQSFNASQKATFDSTLAVGTSQICIYPVFDVIVGPSNGQTIEMEISSVADIDLSHGVINGTFPLALAGTTTLALVNTAPNSPTVLIQEKTDNTVISTGGWTNQTSVRFEVTASDPDTSDNLTLCVESKNISTGFVNTEDSCSSTVAYSGTPVSITHTIAGIADTSEHHWQVRLKDQFSVYSSWVSYGGNAETVRDFGIDTTAPTGGTIFDGSSVGIDASFNNGSLSQLSANWSGFNLDVSGLLNYEYSIGTTVNGTNIVNWTSNGTGTSVTVAGLTLQSSQIYYFNIRANDNAGNFFIKNSDGQVVAPSLSFSISSNFVNFVNLNNANSYSDTKSTILTTSTNAYNGYVVRLFKTDFLRSSANPTNIITDFTGGSYAAPANWASSTGFGYTSDDALIQGVNKFSPPTCAGGGVAPCYAPISSTAPGDIVADHTSLVTGTPISNQTFTITYRVTTPLTQVAGTYSTALVYTIIPQY